MTQHVPERRPDLTKGVAITSSFHADETTHVENCRYGKGSNAMGAARDGRACPAARAARAGVELLRKVGRDPMGFLRLMPIPRHWSERMVIGLVMQSRDNSLHVSGRRGLFGRPGLTSGRATATRTPPTSPRVTRRCRRSRSGSSEATGDYTAAGGSWFEVLDTPMTAHFIGGATIGSSPRPRRARRLPPRVGPPGHLGRRRLGRLGQPRRQPVADHHGAGRARDVAVAQPW